MNDTQVDIRVTFQDSESNQTKKIYDTNAPSTVTDEQIVAFVNAIGALTTLTINGAEKITYESIDLQG